MDQRQIEELILNSTQPESCRRQHAIELLDQLRGDPIRWSIGLSLFFDGSTALSKFFGLSLIREYMSSNGGAPPVAERQKVRDAMMAWLGTHGANVSCVESYVINSIVTIVTLAIKHDFPELWPTAFADILTFGQRGINELDITIRVLSELEVEVVVYNESRSKQEVAHNTIVKDAIRAGPIAGNIVQFLCQSAVSVRPVKASLSAKCLIALSEIIGWVDNGLIVNHTTLPIIYQTLTDVEVAEAGLTCLLELVKKGMDPYLKIQMVASINLLPMLATVKVSDPTTRANGAISVATATAVPALPKRNRGLSWVSSNDGDDNDSVDAGSLEDDVIRELAAVLDVLLLELIGCWSKYEDCIIASLAGGTGPADQQLLESGPVLSDLLNATLPLVMQVFTLGDFYASETVVPSLNKFITLLKNQSSKTESIRKLIELNAANGKYFIGANYLSQLLSAVFRQMQYPLHFPFDGDGDEEIAELEAKKQIRKLFVNCCRVHPSECLQMVTAALSSLHQPLSRGTFPPLEAVLRLVHAFSECGSYFSDLVSSGMFPQLVSALHSTDVIMHPHPQVVMAYFEICSRYARISRPSDIQKVVAGMVGPPGLRNRDVQLRNRTAYLLLKLVESVPGHVCNGLIPAVSSFSDLILIAPGKGAMSALPKELGVAAGPVVSLSRQSELYLLEAVGLMTSSFEWNATSEKARSGADGLMRESPTAAMLTTYSQSMSAGSVDASIPQSQVHLLSIMLDVLVSQLNMIAKHPDQLHCAAELADISSHKLASIAALCRGHSYKKCGTISNPQFEQFQDAVGNIFGTSFPVVSSICQSPLAQYRAVREKGVVYFHRLLQVLGMKILGHVRDSYIHFISNADATDLENVVQLANSLMVEFGSNATSFVDDVLGTTLDRIVYLYSDEGCVASATAALAAQVVDINNVNSDTAAPSPLPSLESTRVLLQRQYLAFLQHTATYNCHAALTSSQNIGRLDSVFSSVIQGLGGGGDGISAQGGIQLRRAALCFLSELSKDWLLQEDSESQPGGPTLNIKVTSEQPPGNKPAVPPPPVQVSAALTSLLFETVLPLALTTCTGGSGLDMRADVQSQGILVDTGVLISTLMSRRPRDTQEYFRRVLLPGLGWHVNAVTPMLALLDTKVPVGTFKESFKKLIRQNLGSSCK